VFWDFIRDTLMTLCAAEPPRAVATILTRGIDNGLVKRGS
jgi:hypothetical protein